MTKTNGPLFKLPRELRDQIYTLCLTPEPASPTAPPPQYVLKRPQNKRPFPPHCRIPSVPRCGLASTCKTIRSEMRDFLRRRTDLRVRLTYLYTAGEPKLGQLEWLSVLPPASALRTVKLEIAFDGTALQDVVPRDFRHEVPLLFLLLNVLLHRGPDLTAVDPLPEPLRVKLVELHVQRCGVDSVCEPPLRHLYNALCERLEIADDQGVFIDKVECFKVFWHGPSPESKKMFTRDSAALSDSHVRFRPCSWDVDLKPILVVDETAVTRLQTTDVGRAWQRIRAETQRIMEADTAALMLQRRRRNSP